MLTWTHDHENLKRFIFMTGSLLLSATLNESAAHRRVLCGQSVPCSRVIQVVLLYFNSLLLQNVFSTYWQAQDMVFRRKSKAEFLCVVADFLQGDTQVCLNQHLHLFSSRIVGYLRQRMIKQNLLLDETQRIFDRGILQSDRRPASCCRASHEEPQCGEHKHRKCHQHRDGLQGRDHHINKEDLTTGEHESSLLNLRSNSQREARKFILTNI